IDAKGVGTALYRAIGPERTYTLVAFGHDLDPAQRSDRVIAEAWDATFALFDGEPREADIERLAANVPLQEAGRVSERELVLSRANRSVRLFDHVIERLAAGLQPDAEAVEEVGYLMRTTAVYGSGKFGAADRAAIAGRPELSGPFRAEMLSVWLIRAFTLDLVEHVARERAPARAVAIDPALRRRFGVGNSTGLGMAPFLVSHPVLINNWMLAREEALARVRAQAEAGPETKSKFRDFLERAKIQVELWRSGHELQVARLSGLKRDLASLSRYVEMQGLDMPFPWDALYRWGEDNLGLEGQEMLVSLLIEPHGDLVDALSDCMDADEAAAFAIDGSVSVAKMLESVEANYCWALETDYEARSGQARFWYVSEEKLEPRLGERFDEPGAECEQPLATGRDIAALATALRAHGPADRLGKFLLRHPEHRHAVRRAQIAEKYPFSEIRDNLISADTMPIDMLRCKLSFFGATAFDPRSDRWVRISMFRGAPFPEEYAKTTLVDDWAWPPLAQPARDSAARGRTS
ncbi:MAG TPA: hypothetical protein VKN63_06415, partial [Afifellaceae bacterium]|nr:hypothetical protein [Afifellaceae bacterium]